METTTQQTETVPSSPKGKKSRKTAAAKKRVLFKKDVKSALKLVDFDPNGEEFKFLNEVYRIGNLEYFKIRAVEELSGKVDKRGLVAAVRLLLLAINEVK